MSEKKIDRKLRVGFIGTGKNAASHIKEYLKCEDAEVVCGADLVPGKAAAFFESFGVEAKSFTDYREMIDTMKPDAVSICAYNASHAECAIYALEHGVNVLLEKPMTITLDEAVEVVKAEKKSGKLLTIGFQPRFDSNMQMIRKVIQSGVLGKVYYVQTGGGRRKGIPAQRSDSFIMKETAGLGALGDIGCYSLDLVMNALGHPKPLSVTGHTTAYFGKDPNYYSEMGLEDYAKKFSVDDFASAYIRLEDDLIIDFRISWAMHMDTTGDTLFLGTKGGLRVPSTECWNGTFKKPMTLYQEVAGRPVSAEIPLVTDCPNIKERKIRSFLDAIREGGKAPVPTSEILYNQAILDGIARSSECGCEVKIEFPEL